MLTRLNIQVAAASLALDAAEQDKPCGASPSAPSAAPSNVAQLLAQQSPLSVLLLSMPGVDLETIGKLVQEQVCAALHIAPGHAPLAFGKSVWGRSLRIHEAQGVFMWLTAAVLNASIWQLKFRGWLLLFVCSRPQNSSCRPEVLKHGLPSSLPSCPRG